MKVPCFKNYELTENDFHSKIAVKRNWVTIYNEICDSCDLCRDKTCRFYDATQEGTRKFIKGSDEANSSIEGLIREEEREKAYMKLYASEVR